MMINRDAVAEKGNDDLAEKIKNSHDIGENCECENRGETRENKIIFLTSIYKYK